MDLKQLEYFVRVAELGSFTKAAMVISVAQPTLSRHVRQLEVELRHNLFNRNGRGISLTDQGSLFLAHARGILEQCDRARQQLDYMEDTPTGRVVIGVPPIVGRVLTTHLAGTFRERFPHASLAIIEGKSWSIQEWLVHGRVDIGVWYSPAPSPHIEITPLIEKHLWLISPAGALPDDATVDVRDLGRFPLILPSQPSTQRSLMEAAAAKAGTQLNVHLEVDGSSFILELVNQGHGHTTLPRYVMQESSYAGRLQANLIVRPELTTTLCYAVSSQRPMTRLAQATADLIETYLSADSEFAAR
ncbi:MAG: LysR family transcriptional regulator [Burkholderiales bacterium]|nr:LysR family transcriptional regulator [Burkholderiales bacterium]